MSRGLPARTWRPNADLAAILRLRGRAAVLRVRDVLPARWCPGGRDAQRCRARRSRDPASGQPLDHGSAFGPGSRPAAGPLYLHTSPEFAMKRLLAAGHRADLPDLQGLSRRRSAAVVIIPSSVCSSGIRPGWDYRRLMDEVGALVGIVLGRPDMAVERVTYRDLFRDGLGTRSLAGRERRVARSCRARWTPRVWMDSTSDRDGWLDLLLTQCLESRLGQRPADLSLRLPAQPGGPGARAHLGRGAGRRALRALHRRDRAGQWVRRAGRRPGTAGAFPGRSRHPARARPVRAAHRRIPARMRSSMGCLNVPAWRSDSTVC
ncbi:MAG: hypothetical protein MZV65_42345 [Chromatiales bacterium]|nr:hypothetical protein [Chromatiales bacterium]